MTVVSMDLSDELSTYRTQNFRYPRLPNDGKAHIRIFRIESVVDTRDRRLLLDLELFELFSKKREYLALSYTWNSPLEGNITSDYNGHDNMREVDISFRGSLLGALGIGRNLYEALETIYKLHGPDQYVWADAVSINQGDKHEKSDQVLLMGQVFREADTVSAWLGRPDPDASYGDVHQILHNMRDAADEAKVSVRSVKKNIVATIDEGVNPKAKPFVLTEEQVLSLNRFFTERRFFQRAWIFQETIGQRKKIEYLLGDYYRLEGERMRDSVKWLASKFVIINGTFRRLECRVRIDVALFNFAHLLWFQDYEKEDIRARFVQDLRLQAMEPGELAEYWGWLIMSLEYTRYMVAGDPRDKIYSVLGHISYFMPAEFVPPLKPDYTITPQALCRQLTFQMLETMTLSYVFKRLPIMSRRKISALPSWVLDCTAFEFLRQLQPVEREVDDLREETRRSRRSNQPPDASARVGRICGLCYQPACGRWFLRATHYPILSDRVANDGLELEGSLCDTITSSQEWDDVKYELDAVAAVRGNVQRTCFMLHILCQLNRDKYVDGTAMLETMFQVTKGGAMSLGLADRPGAIAMQERMVHDVKSMITASKWAAQRRDYNWLADVLEGCLESLAKLDGKFGFPKRSTFRPAVNPPMNSFENEQLLMSGPDAEYQRAKYLYTSLFITKEGYMGFASEDVMPGDEIWKINCQDCQPVVLRKVDATKGSYRIIGQAYIHTGMGVEYFERGLAKKPERICLV